MHKHIYMYRRPKCACAHRHRHIRAHTWVQIHGHACLDVHINFRQQTRPLRTSCLASSRRTPSDALPSGAWQSVVEGAAGGDGDLQGVPDSASASSWETGHLEQRPPRPAPAQGRACRKRYGHSCPASCPSPLAGGPEGKPTMGESGGPHEAPHLAESVPTGAWLLSAQNVPEGSAAASQAP